MMCAIYEKVSVRHEGHREVFGILQVAHDVQLTCTELRERTEKDQGKGSQCSTRSLASLTR